MTDTSTPIPTNPITTVVDTAIDGVFGVAVKAADAAIFAAVPILASPVLNLITDEVIQVIANEIYKQFATWVSFEIITIQTGVEASDSQKALAALKAAQLSGDPNAIQAALTVFQAATESLTHWDGSNPPS